jgi:hypothetical protein
MVFALGLYQTCIGFLILVLIPGRLTSLVYTLDPTLVVTSILRQKEGLLELKYFTMQKYNQSSKKSSKLNETKILQDIITNLKFETQVKISSFQNPHIKKIDLLLLLPRGAKIP